MATSGTARKVIVVGLGNDKFPLTRHSIGQLALEGLHRRLARNSGLGTPMTLNKALPGWTAKHALPFRYEKEHVQVEVTLFKPKCYMNESGPPILRHFRSLISTSPPTFPPPPPPLLIVLHDHLDSPTGTVRLRTPPASSSPKGHNGLKSLVNLSKNFASPPGGQKFDFKTHFYTIPIGIGRDAGARTKESRQVAEWVLGPLSRNEIEGCSWDLDEPNNNVDRGGTTGATVAQVYNQLGAAISLAVAHASKDNPT